MYKCNEQRTMIKSPQVYKECGKYIIHGKSIFMGVVVLSKSQALKIHRELGKLLGCEPRKNESKEEREVRMGTRLVVGRDLLINKLKQ